MLFSQRKTGHNITALKKNREKNILLHTVSVCVSGVYNMHPAEITIHQRNACVFRFLSILSRVSWRSSAVSHRCVPGWLWSAYNVCSPHIHSHCDVCSNEINSRKCLPVDMSLMRNLRIAQDTFISTPIFLTKLSVDRVCCFTCIKQFSKWTLEATLAHMSMAVS